MLDVAGLCVAARNNDYVAAARSSAASSGRTTAIGHASALSPYDAAMINGTAAHGEDYDDTFEGGPVHAGAVIVPAVLAAAEHRGLSGEDIVMGIAVGVEIDVPHEFGSAPGDAQGVLPSDRNFWCTGRSGGRRRGIGFAGRKNRQCHRCRGKPRLGHHRISRGRKFDQAAARRSSGAIGYPRGLSRGRRFHRARDCARRPPRILQSLCAIQDARLHSRCWPS